MAVSSIQLDIQVGRSMDVYRTNVLSYGRQTWISMDVQKTDVFGIS
jgi:hypothetical protein